MGMVYCAVRIISGAKYDVGSKDILKNLKLDLLDVRRKKLKSVLCMVLNRSSAPCLVDYGYDLCDSETDLKLTKPQTNF